MPRKPGIEYAGAVYHVLNRGNCRQDIFTVPGSAESFERVLFAGRLNSFGQGHTGFGV